MHFGVTHSEHSSDVLLGKQTITESVLSATARALRHAVSLNWWNIQFIKVASKLETRRQIETNELYEEENRWG